MCCGWYVNNISDQRYASHKYCSMQKYSINISSTSYNFLLSESVTRNRRVSIMKQVQDIQELIKQIFLTNYNFQQLIN